MMDDLGELQLDNPFWQFSLLQWKNAALQKQLLELQNNKNTRINLLLLSMWMSFEHKDIRSHYAFLVDSCSEWHDLIVAPIRKARKSLPKQFSNSHPFKTHLQNCELQAEQIEQALLYRESLSIPKYENSQFDSLDWLIVNLLASELDKSDLSLLVQNCLPTYPMKRITERLQAHE